MKGFLATCMALMIAAGFFGAGDMVRDLKNGELIDYENVRQRHAQHILAIIKTTGLGTYKFRGNASGKQTITKEQKEHSAREKQNIEKYIEEFSRGDCDEC